MKTYLLLLFNMIMIQAIGQYNIKSTNLSDSGNVIKNDYIKRLDTIFSNSKIIGLGESTHGTSEFSIIRIHIFKYLVYNHNYTTFFWKKTMVLVLELIDMSKEKIIIRN